MIFLAVYNDDFYGYSNIVRSWVARELQKTAESDFVEEFKYETFRNCIAIILLVGPQWEELFHDSKRLQEVEIAQAVNIPIFPVLIDASHFPNVISQITTQKPCYLSNKTNNYFEIDTLLGNIKSLQLYPKELPLTICATAHFWFVKSLVKDGEQVEVGDKVATVFDGDFTYLLKSECSGEVMECLCKEGDELKFNDVVFLINP